MSIFRDIEPLTNYFHPGKLADLSAVSFVTGILHQKLLHMCQDTEMRSIIYSSPDLDQIDSIPKSFRPTLDELITRAKKSWTEWWHHHHETFFFSRQHPDTMIDWFDDLVWLPEGTINYEQTARKMLSNEKLTEVQKFQLACSYCFIDDVERLKQTLTNDEMENATDGHRRYRDEFLNYWSRKVNMKRNVDYKTLLDRLLSFSYYLSKYDLEFYDEFSAINFFLNQISERKRSFRIEYIIDFYKPRLTWLLLPTLNEVELHSILRSRGYRIMKTLLKNRYFFDFALSVWNRLVCVIDNDKLSKILRYVNVLEFERADVNDLLWKMWQVTSKHQKRFIVDKRLCDFTEDRMCDEFGDDYYVPNFPLILDLLSRYSPEHRFRYWENHWAYLVIGQLAQRKCIERIMKLCLDNDQKIQDFKNTSMIECDAIAKYCKILMKKGRVRDIQTYLEFCTSDSQLIRDLKKKMIDKIPKDEFFDILFYSHRRNDESVADFNHYFNDVFTEKKRKKIFNKVVTCRSNLQKMCNMLTAKNLGEVFKFFEAFVSSEESLTKVKSHFFKACCSRGFLGTSERLDSLAWCLNGDRLLVENLKKITSSTNEEVPRKKRKLDRKLRDVYKIFVNPYDKYRL